MKSPAPVNSLEGSIEPAPSGDTTPGFPMNLLEASPDEFIEQDYASLVAVYYQPLYRFAVSLARSSSDACDLTQQTFLVWSTKGHTLRDKSKVKTWLFTTLYREFLHGRRQKQRLVAIEDLAPQERDIPDVSANAVNKMDAQLVLEALQEVEQSFREPLTFFYLRDHSYQEIADILDAPIGTVMSRLFRGKAQLRELLARKCGEAEADVMPAG